MSERLVFFCTRVCGASFVGAVLCYCVGLVCGGFKSSHWRGCIAKITSLMRT
jgi:hypothetical protein